MRARSDNDDLRRDQYEQGSLTSYFNKPAAREHICEPAHKPTLVYVGSEALPTSIKEKESPRAYLVSTV